MWPILGGQICTGWDGRGPCRSGCMPLNRPSGYHLWRPQNRLASSLSYRFLIIYQLALSVLSPYQRWPSPSSICLHLENLVHKERSSCRQDASKMVSIAQFYHLNETCFVISHSREIYKVAYANRELSHLGTKGSWQHIHF